MEGKIQGLIRGREGHGFVFIATEDDKEVFFHCSPLEGIDFDALEEGDGAKFNLERGPKGPRAVNIRKQLGKAIFFLWAY